MARPYYYDGLKIRSLRKARGLTMVQLGQMAGIKPSSLCHLEKNITKNPKGSTLINLAAALGVTLDKILKEPHPNSAPTEAAALMAVFNSLSGPNKRVILTAAQALAEAQTKRK